MVKSALVGQPPLTQDDYWIVRGNLLEFGLVNLDPSKGLQIPPFRPPPDKYHFHTRGPAIIGVCSLSIVIMLFVTVSRLLVRRFKKDVKFGRDDWLIIPATVLALLWPILFIAAVKQGGYGKHMYDVSYHELYMGNWHGSFAKMDFFVALGFIKLSIVCFNMRLTGISSKKWMYAHWTFFGVLIIYILAAIFIVTFACSPVTAGFNTIAEGKLDKPPKCLSQSAQGNPLSVWHVVMDFCLLAVPILVLWKVKLPWFTKIRLFLLFSVGAICCFASVMRQIAQARLKKDVTYNLSTLFYWSFVDLTMSNVVASLPILASALPGRKNTRKTGASSSYGISRPKDSHPLGSDTHSKTSREGIMRQDEVELEFHEIAPANLEDGHIPTGNISKDAYQVEQHTMPWASNNRL